MNQDHLFQIPLDFEQPVARKSDPQTSKDSAKKVNISSVRAAIIKTLRENPAGLATFQIAELLFQPRDYISPHMKKLVGYGYIRKTGTTVVNHKTKSKSQSEVYAAVLSKSLTEDMMSAAEGFKLQSQNIQEIEIVVRVVRTLHRREANFLEEIKEFLRGYKKK